MDNEKTRKVRLTDLIDQLKEAGDAATKAMNGDKMMRQYERAMKAATGSLHLAAYGAMRDAAFSKASRVAEMARPVVPDFTRQLAEVSDAVRQLTDATIGSVRFSQIGAGMQLWRKQMEVTFNAADLLPPTLTRSLISASLSRSQFSAADLLPPSLTQRFFSSVHRELNKALDFSYILEEAHIERMNHLQGIIHNSFAARAASLPELRERPMPILLRRKRQSERANVAAQFLNSFRQEYDEAVKEAEEEGRHVIVSSRTPSGDPIRVAQLSSVGDHFVLVKGFDQDQRPRSFKANCGGLDLAIEIVPIEEDPEEETGEDNDVVN